MSAKASRRGWAIKGRGGYLFSYKGMRKEATADCIGGSTLSWRNWKRKYGLRAVKVEIREL